MKAPRRRARAVRQQSLPNPWSARHRGFHATPSSGRRLGRRTSCQSDIATPPSMRRLRMRVVIRRGAGAKRLCRVTRRSTSERRRRLCDDDGSSWASTVSASQDARRSPVRGSDSAGGTTLIVVGARYGKKGRCCAVQPVGSSRRTREIGGQTDRAPGDPPTDGPSGDARGGTYRLDTRLREPYTDTRSFSTSCTL